MSSLRKDYKDIIWKTAKEDVPLLKEQVERVLKDLGSKQLKLKP